MNMLKIWTILKGGRGGGNGISQMDICPWTEGSIQPTDAKRTVHLTPGLQVGAKQSTPTRFDKHHINEEVGEKRDITEILYGNYFHPDRKDIRLDFSEDECTPLDEKGVLDQPMQRKLFTSHAV